MRKIKERNGFTLAELLIVVAIIAVLVAIAIPVFSAQLKSSQLATVTANARSAYAEYVADEMGKGSQPTISGVTTAVNSAISNGCSITVSTGKVTVSLSGASNSPMEFAIDSDIK